MPFEIVVQGPLKDAQRLLDFAEGAGLTIVSHSVVDADRDSEDVISLEPLDTRLTHFLPETSREIDDEALLTAAGIECPRDLSRLTAAEVWRRTGRYGYGSEVDKRDPKSTLFARICGVMAEHNWTFADSNPRDFTLTAKAWYAGVDWLRPGLSSGQGTRLCNALVRAGIKGHAVLAGLTDADLCRLPGIDSITKDLRALIASLP